MSDVDRLQVTIANRQERQKVKALHEGLKRVADLLSDLLEFDERQEGETQQRTASALPGDVRYEDAVVKTALPLEPGAFLDRLWSDLHGDAGPLEGVGVDGEVDLPEGGSSLKERAEKEAQSRRVAREENATRAREFLADLLSAEPDPVQFNIGTYREVRRRAYQMAQEIMARTAKEFSNGTREARDGMVRVASEAVEVLQRFLTKAGHSDVECSQLPTA